ncbi:winged helix-turn-helix transcriptional regulator [Kribbella caucasensis]|nr:winged helix-turn-helix transcriptional regulator [Kribbella sp. VKM Ac-2527]
MESPRAYGQACPLACALDVLGERWTLLVVRELLLGPKRFKDLGDRLPAAGPNRLTTRLRRLQGAGVVSKTEAGAYVLTAYGEGLREPVIGLSLWGLGLMSNVDPATARADMVALAMSGALTPARLEGLDLSVEVHVGDVFTMTVGGGVMNVRSGPSESPSALRLRCSPSAFIDLSLGSTTLAGARRSGEVRTEGKAPGLPRLFAVFGATAREYAPNL